MSHPARHDGALAGLGRHPTLRLEMRTRDDGPRAIPTPPSAPQPQPMSMIRITSLPVFLKCTSDEMTRSQASIFWSRRTMCGRHCSGSAPSSRISPMSRKTFRTSLSLSLFPSAMVGSLPRPRALNYTRHMRQSGPRGSIVDLGRRERNRKHDPGGWDPRAIAFSILPLERLTEAALMRRPPRTAEDVPPGKEVVRLTGATDGQRHRQLHYVALRRTAGPA